MPLVRRGQPGASEVLPELRHPADVRTDGRRGAQGRHRFVLRSGRVHEVVGPGRPRGRPGQDPPVSRAAPRGARAVRGNRREVHRRRRDGRLRRPRLPRGRRRTGRSGGPPPARGDRGPQRGRPGARPVGPDRDQHRGGRRRPRRAARGRRGPRHRRCRQHGVASAVRRPGRRDRRRRSHVPGHVAGLRLRRARARQRQGQGRAAADLARPAGPRQVRHRHHAFARDGPRRQGARTHDAREHVRTIRSRLVGAARHDRRRARGRQEPAGRGALVVHRRLPGPGPLASGKVPSLRGGHHVLGARRDREGRGRDPRVGLVGDGRPQARPVGLGRRAGPGVAEGPAGAAGRAGVGVERRARRVVHRLAPVPRADGRLQPDRARDRRPALGRPGDARVPRARRRLVRGRPDAARVHRAARALRASLGMGRRQAQREHDQPRSAHGRRDRPADLRAPRSRGAPRRGAIADPGARRGTRCTRRSSSACFATGA